MAAAYLRRCSALLALALTATMLLVTGPAGPAMADPEGGTKRLRDALESAAKGQADAIQKLKASQKRQADLTTTVRRAQASAATLQAQVAVIANRSYRLGRTSAIGMLIDSSSPDVFLGRIQHLDLLAQLDGQVLSQYRASLSEAQTAKAAVEREIAEQRKQVAALTKKKKEAELALGSIGGGGAAGGFLSANSPLAVPAPRNSDGSWPNESCTVTDPTGTGGCVTPRTLHAYKEARADGFTHYTKCYRSQSSGEHGKGRACDFSANASTFKNAAATGSDKAYGNRLAAYFIKNADRLGVLYVIWYREIWLPASGWKAYSASGDPAAVHTNHVHLSML